MMTSSIRLLALAACIAFGSLAPMAPPAVADDLEASGEGSDDSRVSDSGDSEGSGDGSSCYDAAVSRC